MRLILTKKSANSKTDLCQFIRQDGSVDELNLPRQGILPHDLVHYVVESKLKSQFALQHGFLSLVARGARASFVMELAHVADVNKIEEAAIQVEAIVEALQTQLWNGSYEHAYFIYGIQTAAQSRQTVCPELPDAIMGKQLFDAAVALNLEWQQLVPCAVMELHFPE